ncbi:MAG: precorrin-3B C(17)-methyltransferase [Oscillospiraceae bacterium]|nr:precorrin-3B C(17)-methyltransferase [Oscillospiraceae bacterium]
MTIRAVRAIKNAEVVTGYTYYINLISDMLKGKEIFSSAMTKEVERCRKALQYALSGKTVAMVSSGDTGVYGMAGLIYEVCKDHPNVEIEVIPGVTAACSGAAVVGAPLTHDFAVISLSDLLTPWEVIEKRIRSAAAADFSICIYNPSSKKRADYLAKACGYILQYRSPDTPCAYVENIGRDGENYTICTLGELKDARTNMFTTVFIGSSRTKIINGKIVTQRGYRDI